MEAPVIAALKTAYQRTCEAFWPRDDAALIIGRNYFWYEEFTHGLDKRVSATFATFMGIHSGERRWHVIGSGVGTSKFLAFCNLSANCYPVATRFFAELEKEMRA